MTAESTLHIKTLGGLSIELDGRPLTNFVSTKAEALLVYLACNPRQHPRETLADLLWDDRTQRQAMSNLRTVLYSLRKEVGPFVTITRKTAAINPESNLSNDALELESAVSPGGIQSEAQAQEAEQALALYNGDFLAGFFLPEAAEFESWTAAHRENLHRTFVDASLQLGQWHIDQRQYPSAITTATRLLQIDPLAEVGHRQLMEALARSSQRAEALAQYEKCRQILDEELGLEPEAETKSLFETIRSGSLPSQDFISEKESAFIPPRPTLPPKTARIFGREKEMAELRQLLTNGTDLVTIVGPGGMGKTTLALETAHNLASHFDDGAAFVSLTSLSSPDALVPAIAKALKYEFLERSEANQTKELIHYLSHKKLLLVIDNFEHLLDAAPLLTEIIQTAPNVRLIVTSRERLKLQVEQVYPLQGFVLSHWNTLEEAIQDPAVQLFLDHGQRIRPAFTLRQEHLEPLQEIFQLVGGMPLAIILSAGWIEVLSPAEILSEISRNLDLLEATMRDIPDRHQSMRAVFDGTWNRLRQSEQQIFTALSVFKGGFTLEAAREVVQATPRDLIQLVDRSMIVRGEDGRFDIHELLRQFGTENLVREAIQENNIYRRYSNYFSEFLKQRASDLKGSRVDEAEAEITADLQNIRTAWNWAVENDVQMVFNAQRALGLYIGRLNLWTEGEATFLFATSILGKQKSSYPLQMAELLAWASDIVEVRSPEKAKQFLEQAKQCLAKAKEFGEDIRPVRALILQTESFLYDLQLDVVKQLLEESLAIYEELGWRWDIALVNYQLATQLYNTQNEYFLARKYFLQAQKLWDLVGDKRAALRSKVHIAKIDGYMGELDKSLRDLNDALNFYKAENDEWNTAHVLYRIGHTMIISGEFENALPVFDECYVILDRRGNSGWSRACIRDKWWPMLHSGNYDEVHYQIENFSKAHLDSGERDSFNVGMINFIEGCRNLALTRLNEAQHCLIKSIEIFKKHVTLNELDWARIVLGYVELFLGNVSKSQNLFAKSIKLRLFRSLLLALPGTALLQSELGFPERGIELYALACNYNFVSNSQWIFDVAGTKIETLAATMPAEKVSAFRERGKGLDLWQTAESLLQELTTLT